MKAHIITDFPDSMQGYLQTSIMNQAQKKGLFEVEFYKLGDFSDRPTRRVDDRPFGGGAGTLICPEPIHKAISHIEKLHGEMTKIFLGPRGEFWDHNQASKFAKNYVNKDVLILCGHYEGVDHRIFDIFDFQIYSLGQYILSSGELASLVLLDSVVRLLPGVLGNSDSLSEESYCDQFEGKSEYPQYTRPQDFKGHKVPPELISGDPKKVQQWQQNNL